MSSDSSAEYDVIVVGSGAGLVGAYAAASRGLRTLVIEKTEFIGGTTAYSGAGIWLPGNAAEKRGGVNSGPDEARPYLDAIVGDDSPASLRETFLQAGGPLIDELEKNPQFGQFFWLGVPDYFADAPNALQDGRTIFPQDIARSELGDLEPLVRRPLWTERWGDPVDETMSGGQALVARSLLAFVGTGNGTVLTNTALETLIVEDGAVVGVETTSPEGEKKRFRASRGVLLASGGFERNAELRKNYEPLVGDTWTQGAPGNTGTALQAAMAIGAATDLLEEAWYAPGLVVPNTRPIFFTTVWSGIFVNSNGERFMNERLPYDRAGHAILEEHRKPGVSAFPTHWVFDQRQIDNERAFAGLPVNPQASGWFDAEKFTEAGVLTKADTLEELAEKLGLPVGALIKTVDRFNDFARSGVDEDFHRGETPWDQMITKAVSPHTDGPNPCIGVIDQGPFYSAQIVLSDLGTKGGVKTDERARVLNTEGEVIPGLYASGNAMAPMSGRIYPGAGGPVGSSMVFSWVAARDMAGEIA
ncbi:FAD-dependent oxidoreductase [Nocardioides sp. cx-169]|uniref:FAD-dependent oxidoreductase n=1 Tax=Nocardioides sp. cx-169 TaxID=2899080 RepID=UPI001E59509E|nr:FAD-dependent oxidoreductase [Nocardioides sp. cx-169]MCD4533064.1 FAD-dependent oxidoreductase [Nocardioides sp. cx-169]